MEKFLIIILILSQISSLLVIGFIVERFNSNIKEVVTIISQTYLTKIEQEFEIKGNSKIEGYDPQETEELTPEEVLSFTLNQTKKD